MDPIGRQPLQDLLLRDRCGRIDPFVDRRPELAREFDVELAGIAADPRRYFCCEETKDDSVLVRGPDRTVHAQH